MKITNVGLICVAAIVGSVVCAVTGHYSGAIFFGVFAVIVGYDA